MTPDTLKAIAKRWIVGIWDHAEFSLINELASDDYSFDAPGHVPMHGQAFRDFVMAVRTAFPDLENSIETQVSEGTVVVTWHDARDPSRNFRRAGADREKNCRSMGHVHDVRERPDRRRLGNL